MEHILPMDILRKGRYAFILTPPIQQELTPPRPYPVLTWSAYLSTLPQWEQRIVRDISTPIEQLWYDSTTSHAVANCE